MSPTDLCPDEAELEDLLIGRLDGVRAERLEEHLSACPSCASRAEGLGGEDDLVAALRRNERLLAEDAGVETVVEETRRRLAEALPHLRLRGVALGPSASAEELGWLGSYRVLEVLGQGGMGVVLLARHEQIGRRVALKVLAGGRPSRERVQRFRREAEAAARVQHAGVVQLYEVGEWQGAPYLAMEYVEGGSLAARLAEGPLPARQAAEWLEALARGAQAIHDAGIVHRDLKPGNVLLSISREPPASAPAHALAGGSRLNDVVPKIADFGLARALDEPGQTKTGAVLGTPSYMAPEQADGRPVTAATDVYSLGAVLYEMLTGRPPFRGATPLETLAQVRDLEPVAPGRLRPELPIDLETICLKCLEKDPKKRYFSALTLADDLRRYLEDRPTLARPAGLLERLHKWARRRPAVAALVSVSALALAGMAGGAVIYESRLRGARDQSDRNYHHAVEEGARADGNYKKARDTLRKMLERTRDRRWGATPLLRQLQREQIEDALAFFDDVARQQSDDPAVKLDVARTLMEASKAQRVLGRTKESEDNLTRADGLSAALLAERPEDVDVRMLRADVLLSLGALRGPAAVTEQAVADLEKLVGDHPALAKPRQYLANSLSTLGAQYYNEKQYPRAEQALLRAIQLYDGLIQEGGREDDLVVARARARLNLTAVYRVLKRPGQVGPTNALAEADLERQLARHPADSQTIDGLAALRQNRAYDLLAEGKPQEALDHVSRNLPMLEQARRREPDDLGVRTNLQYTHGVRATMLQKLERHADALRAWEEMMAHAPPGEQFRHRVQRLQLLSYAGDFARLADELDALRKEDHPGKVASTWKTLAHYYGVLAGRAGKDGKPQRRFLDAQKESLDRARELEKKP